MTQHSGFFVSLGVTSFPDGGLTSTTYTGNATVASNSCNYANSASQLTFTLPPSPALGDVVKGIGTGTGGFIFSRNGSQNIYDATTSGTTALTTLTVPAKATVTLVYAAANKWNVISARGTLVGA